MAEKVTGNMGLHLVASYRCSRVSLCPCF